MELLHLCVPKLSCLKGHPDASETCRLTGPIVGLGWSSFKGSLADTTGNFGRYHYGPQGSYGPVTLSFPHDCSGGDTQDYGRSSLMRQKEKGVLASLRNPLASVGHTQFILLAIAPFQVVPLKTPGAGAGPEKLLMILP